MVARPLSIAKMNILMIGIAPPIACIIADPVPYILEAKRKIMITLKIDIQIIKHHVIIGSVSLIADNTLEMIKIPI